MNPLSVRLIHAVPGKPPLIREFNIPEQESLEATDVVIDDELINSATNIVVKYLEKKLNSDNLLSLDDPNKTEIIELPGYDSGGIDIQGSYISYYTVGSHMDGPLKPAIGLQLGRKTNSRIPQTTAMYTIIIDENSLKNKKVEEEMRNDIRAVVESLLYEAVPLLAKRARAKGWVES